MILIPQYRTARRASASAELLESKTTSAGTSVTITFDATPEDGEFLVALVIMQNTSANPTTVPSGWALAHSVTGVSGRSHHFYTRTAASEAGPSYTWGNSGTIGVRAYRFSAGASIQSWDSKVTNLATASADAADPDVSVTGPAFAIVAFSWQNSVAGGAFDNGFTYNGLTSRGCWGDQEYPTSQSGQNCTFSWTGGTSSNMVGSFTVIGL